MQKRQAEKASRKKVTTTPKPARNTFKGMPQGTMAKESKAKQDMDEVFDCPMNDREVTRKDCKVCRYHMKDESYTGCGWLKNGKRGGGVGKDRYVKPKAE